MGDRSRDAFSCLRLTLFCAFFFLGVTAAEAFDFTPWIYSGVIKLNTTAAGVTTNVTNFPVLIRLTSANFNGFSIALAGGADIRFSKSDGVTPLNFQIQRWDATNRVAEIWVKVDTVYGSNSTQSIKMYWGNASAAQASSGPAVFDTTNGFQGVWHLSEATNATALDATINGYNGTPGGATVPADVAGVIARAKYFDGASSSFVMNNTASGKLNFPQSGTYTLSAWANPSVLGASGIFSDICNKSDLQYNLCINDQPTGNTWEMTEFESNVGWQSTRSTAAAVVNAWHYITGIRNGANQYMYVDGVLVGSTIVPTANAVARDETRNVGVGALTNTTISDWFHGTIEEVRMENTARSADWVKLCFQNQQATQALVSVVSPAGLTYSTNPATYVSGTAIAANNPSSTGGPISSYSVSPALPAGLTLSTTTGGITGTPTTASLATNYTVTATNAAGTTTCVLSITVNAGLLPPSNLTYSLNPASYTTGTAITANNPSSSGGAVVSYSVSPTLPTGLTLSTTTGVITGTPTTASSATNYTVTATNTAGSTTCVLSIAVTAGLLPPANLTYSTNPASYVTGTAITANNPSSSGGAVVSYSISPALPSGLALNASTGVITGIPTIVTAASNFTVNATNSAGSTTCVLSITITAALLPPAGLTYSKNPAVYTIGTAITANNPSSTGGAVASYSVAPALPAGLTLSATTGVITGTPTTASLAANYTVTATNAAGSTTCVLSITVVTAPTGLSYKRNPLTCVTNIAITPDSAVVSGTTVIDSFTVSPALPAGLTLARTTGIISGTPTTATSTANYTVTARNVAGSTTVVLSVTVVAPPVGLSYRQNPVTYVTGTAITPDSAVLTGGSAIDSFTVSPVLPAGLTLAKTTGIISGTPTTAIAAASYTVTARNIAGTATAVVSITITSALLPPANLTYSANPASYIVGTAIAANNPSSSGGTVASYSVAPALPAGLTMSTTTGVITGTPTVAKGSANYTVTATNASGFTTTAITITVYTAVKAAIWSHDSSGPAPLTTQFNDTSTGSYSQRKWDFGDGTIDTVLKSPTHTFSNAGSFVVKLTVWGNGGLDSAKKTILTWTPGSNPLQMDGTYLMTNPAGDSQKVAILIRNINAISPPALVVVDSVGLWFLSGKIPTSPDSSRYKKKYLLSTLQSPPGGSQYADTVMVPAVPAVPGYCGFMTAISWSDGKRTPFASGNGVLVLMKDLVAPTNALTLSGQYLPNDTARLYIGNISTVDTTKVDSMFIWYSLTTDSADFTDKTFTRGLSMAEVTKSLVNGQYQFSIVNPLFSLSKKTIYCAVMVMGKNDLASPMKKYQFTVGFDRPANPITLHAKALSATRIQLNWNDISAAGVSRIVIWYKTGSPVDTVYDVTAQNLDSLSPALLTDTVVIGDKFNELTQYYFGAQVFKGGLWSQITTNASATATTPAALAKLDSNTVHLVKPTLFDTVTNTIRLRWTVNRAVGDSLSLGISYSTVSMPTQDTSVGQVINVTSGADSAVVKLHEDIAFNAKYYMALWLRRPGGKWTDPTVSSSDSVRTPAFTWQSVIYFTRDPDSVYAFNREIRLMNRPLDQSATVNTVRYVVIPSSAKTDFTQVSVAVEFSVKDRGAPFYIGFKVDSIPAGYSLSDVRIYRDSAGFLLLSREPVVYDAAKQYVSVLTNDLDFPLVAMVDRRAPTAEPLTDVSALVVASKPVTDRVVVHDNIANCTWRSLVARGGDAYDTLSNKIGGTLNDTCETLSVTIDANYVTQDNGVRALLIVSDGVHFDTVNLSRSVIRDGSDIAFTDPEKWVPLSVNAVLDSTSAKYVLRDLSANSASEWKYDNTKFRIFKCYPVSGDQYPWKWVEYADTLADEFEFVRGNLIWVKALEERTVRYGPSHTASLTAVFPIRMAPMAWTDFSLPFKFDVTVGDMLNITSNADSLAFYSWNRDLKTGRYSSELCFMKAMPNVHYNNLATPLSSTSGGYTVYNPRSDTVILNVPPLPVALSHQATLAKKATASTSPGWTVRVVSNADDGSSLSSVFCGYTPLQSGGVSYYPLAPSFGNVHSAVCDDNGKKAYGIAIAHGKADHGWAYMLAFVNDGTSPGRISYHIEQSGTLPQGMTAAVWNNESGKFEDLGAATGEASVTIGAAGARVYRTLLVGDAGFLAKAKQIARPSLLALVGTYPNPFKGIVHIRYSIPFNGIDKLKFTICDLRGAVAWRRTIGCSGHSGPGELVWNGITEGGRASGAGVYIVKMSALDAKGKQAGAFEKKMTLFQ
jgi:PKD repeat protein